MNHITGLEQLFAIHGPAFEKNDPLYSALLELTRLVMIVAALKARRPSLMAQPKWSAVGGLTFSDHLSPDSAISYLLDALAQIPTLYHERDIIVSARKELSALATSSEESPYSSRVRILLNRSLHILHDVRSKRTQWKYSHPNDDFPTLSHTNIPSSQPRPCTVVTHFSSLSAANASTLYSTVVILINQLLISMCQFLSLTEFDVLSASGQISIAVIEILASIDYYLTSSNHTAMSAIGASSSNFYLFPVRVAYQALSQSASPEDVSRKVWLEDASVIIEGRMGPWASNKKLFHVGRR